MSTLACSQTKAVYPSGTIVPTQRTGATTARAVSGTWSGTTPTGFEASWLGGAYAALSGVTVGAGTWSATLPAYAPGDGTLVLRFTNEPATTLSTELVIGDFWHVWGDSTTKSATNSGATMPPNIWEYDGAGAVWFRTTSNGTSHWPYVMQLLAADRGYPMGYVMTGVSGTKLLADWQQGQATYTTAISRCTASGADAFKANVGQVGLNDMQPSGSTPTTAALVAGLANTPTGFAAALPGAPPTFNWIWSENYAGPWGGLTAAFRADSDTVRQATLSARTAGTILIGANLTGHDWADDEHPSTEAGKILLAYQWWAAIATACYGAAAASPRVVSVTQAADAVTFRVTCDQTLSNSLSSAVDGFRLMDNGTAVALTSATVTAPRVVTLVAAAPVVGTATVSFASSQDAINGTLPQRTVTLPTAAFGDATTPLPLEPFFNLGVTAYVPGHFTTAFAGAIR